MYLLKPSDMDEDEVEYVLKKKQKNINSGAPGGSVVEHLPSAQGVNLGSQDQVPHRHPFGEPVSPSAYVSASAPLCISHE